MEYTYQDIARMIDHAVLKPDASVGELKEGVELAVEYGVATVCIPPYFVKECAPMLAGTPVLACTTISFPHGGQSTVVKVAESMQALKDGARELDMVVNVSRVVSEQWAEVQEDIAAVVQVVHEEGAKLKVIFENALLNEEQKIRLCQICGELGVDWIKTSTGFAAGGATLDDVKLMRRHAPADVQIKASGGVRTLDDVLAFRALGVSRVGASGTRKILDACKQQRARA